MDFRKITAIIQKDALEKVEDQLRKLGVPGISVTHVKGYGHYANFFSKDWLVSHVRIEVFIGQERAEEVATAIMNAAHTGMDGDGIVAVLPVESVYQIQTLQKCVKDVCD
ncbi:MAG TPA: P-II family nitrogen regulator [Desulfobacteraceae bacterium]|nr:P-II family nitrogen regulator [Desulfobacteraceae bacterium]HDL98497.1 P-II family nitrogen regulator [Desulfobacteraceae bacterium]HDO30177.1 P-II family nitrogen regulator [Desulfobacteraceae bacterium]HDZ76266.1 P-II family nitrogen regulator [Desulfobacteraceae bacterium]